MQFAHIDFYYENMKKHWHCWEWYFSSWNCTIMLQRLL